MIKIKNIILSLFLFLSLSVCLPATISAQEVYTITHSELTQLETNLKQAKDLIKTYEMNSSEQTQDLIQLQQKLQKVEILLTESQIALKTMTERSEQLENSLMKANQSLKMYEKEMKKKTRILKYQRNLAYTLLGGTVIYAITK